MKNLFKVMVLFSMLVFLSSNGHCQENFIIAGNTEGVLYTDIRDTTINTWEIKGEGYIELDLNQDNEFDFIISGHYASGISHETSYFSIEPYGHNKVAFSDSIPAIGLENHDTIFFANRAKGLNANDTINSNIHFITDQVYFNYKSVVATMYNINFSWGTWGFIPVYMEGERDEKPIYGWIKVSSVASRSMIIESFAITLESNSINTKWIEDEIKVYPNPCTNFIIVKPPLNSNDFTIDIYNTLGQKQRVRPMASDESFNIPISHLSNGVYLLKMTTNNKSSVIKVIKK